MNSADRRIVCSRAVRPDPRLYPGILGYRRFGSTAEGFGKQDDAESGAATLSFVLDHDDCWDPACGEPVVLFESALARWVAREVTVPAGRHCAGVDVLVQPWAVSKLLGPTHRNVVLSPRRTAVPVHAGLRNLLGKLAGVSGWRTRMAVLDTALVHRWETMPGTSPSVQRAWNVMTGANGSLPISQVATEVGTSHRQLVRQFSEQIGMPPKTVARVLRLHHALRLLSAGRPASEVAAECEFYDQPHLTRECRALTGMSPRQLVAVEALMADFSKTASRKPVKYERTGRSDRRSREHKEAVDEMAFGYEAPAVVEIGDFAELTHGSGTQPWIDSPWGFWWL